MLLVTLLGAVRAGRAHTGPQGAQHASKRPACTPETKPRQMSWLIATEEPGSAESLIMIIASSFATSTHAADSHRLLRRHSKPSRWLESTCPPRGVTGDAVQPLLLTVGIKDLSLSTATSQERSLRPTVREAPHQDESSSLRWHGPMRYSIRSSKSPFLTPITNSRNSSTV